MVDDRFTVVVGAVGESLWMHRPGERYWATSARHVGELVEASGGADVIIVHGSAFDRFKLPASIPSESKRRKAKVPLRAFVTAALRAGWMVDPGGLSWRLMVRPNAGGRWTSVILLPYVENERLGPWAELDVATMARGMAVFERLVGVPWRDTVGRTVERLILATHPRERGGTYLDMSPMVPEPALDGRLEQPTVWRRALTCDEQDAPYLHAYDQNAQYLAAWQVVELGLGVPQHSPAGAPMMFDPRTVGLWRIKLPPAGTPATGGLPLPWSSMQEWFTTPTVIRMTELGYTVDVDEAWCWPRRSRFLRAAGERLRDARRQLVCTSVHDPQQHKAALDAVKACYRVGTGRFNMDARDERSGWRRPDWGHLIRATARVNLDRRFRKLSQAPFAIATDGLLFATDEPDPHLFAQQLHTDADPVGLPLGDGLGQFSVKGTWKLTDERIDTIERAQSAGAIYKELAAWERHS